LKELRSTVVNLADTSDFKAAGGEQIRLLGFITPAGYQLMRSADGKQYRLIHSGYTVHCVELKETGYSVPGISNAVESDTWRTTRCEYQSALAGYSARLIEWISERYSLLIVNPCIQRFWEYRLSEAVENSTQRVLFWDSVQAIEIHNQGELSEAIWSGQPDGMTKPLLIITSAKAGEENAN